MACAVHVPFLTVEDDDDLIVSFGLGEHAENSLTLLRTPKFESMLDEGERGVSVGLGDSEAEGGELLISLTWSDKLVELESTARRYLLDVSTVDAEEVSAAKAVLRKMNFDGRFRLANV